MSIGPLSGSGSNSIGPTDDGWGKGEMPPGKPLPADDPWVKALQTLFPNLPLPEVQAYAAQFRDNMFNALQNEISRDAKKAKEAAQKAKDAITGND